MKKIRYRRRRGNILVLTAFLLTVMMALLAFTVDLGVLATARNELQRTADSAALAGCWELIDSGQLSGEDNNLVLGNNARDSASQFANLNRVLGGSPSLGTSDVTVGYLNDPTNNFEPISSPAGIRPNVVQVRVQRSAAMNGNIPLFFARIIGMDSIAAEAQATAAVVGSFNGFHTPSDGSSLEILPFALDEVTWNNLLAGVASDNYKYNAETGGVTVGCDGIKEVNLYPQGTGSPGNRGTVDIGSCNNSTSDIARQIVSGISAEDFEHHGGSLEFNSSGELYLNGDTGISAGVKDELASIIGDTRIIPIFRSVAGPGNNAQYTIVKFAGVRIMNVKLTGSMSGKNVMIQPANVIAKGGIRGEVSRTNYVFSPVWLVR